MRKIFLLACLLLSGCDSSKLSDIEKASKQAANCRVHQIMPTECEEFVRALEIAELKATQSGIDHERISASRQIGDKIVIGSANDSPYQRVKRSFESKPFYIEPIEANFTPYKTNCPEFNFDDENPDFDELFKATEWSIRDKKEYQTVGYFQNGSILNVLFSKTASPCRPKAYSDIQDQFPILTEGQLNKFKNGIYLKKTFYPGYSSVNAFIFDTFKEAKEKYHELTGKSDKQS